VVVAAVRHTIINMGLPEQANLVQLTQVGAQEADTTLAGAQQLAAQAARALLLSDIKC
jgi:hypothetical protein